MLDSFSYPATSSLLRSQLIEIMEIELNEMEKERESDRDSIESIAIIKTYERVTVAVLLLLLLLHGMVQVVHV